jgi:hypothetical protein
MKKLLDISSDERRRILEMHQTATKRNYLSEAPEPAASPQQTAAPQKAAATGSGLINLMFVDKQSQTSAWYAAGSLDVRYDPANTLNNLKKMQNYPTSKIGYAVIPVKGYTANQIATAPFYLINYEMDSQGRTIGGDNPGKIQSFEFTPDPSYTAKYGEPTVTLDYSKEIIGYKTMGGEASNTIQIGAYRLFYSNLPTGFNIMLTTPSKAVDVPKKDDKPVASSSPGMLKDNILVGIAKITTNDSTNPNKEIKLYVPKGATFAVPNPSSAPTPVTPRT